MKFLMLFIRKNMRYRKANYLLPFLSFVLSGVLLCTSVFYLTLASDFNIVSQHVYPYDMVMKSSNAHDDAVISEAMQDNDTFVRGFVQEYLDLLPLFREEIDAFDDAVVHKHLNFASIGPSSPLAAFYADYGCDVSALSANEIYAAPYMLYYFQNHIDDGILTLPAQTENGTPLSFRIVGLLDPRVSDDANFAVICADDAAFQTMRQMYGTIASMHFYDFADDFVHTRENYHEALNNLWTTEESVPVRLHSSASIEESHAIYSGDAAIAVFNLFFAVLCIVTTLKLKLSSEFSDYRKMDALGLSPVLRFFIPFADIGIPVLPAYLIAFPFSVLLFSRIAPYTEQTYRSTVITHYFQYSHALLLVTFLLFAAGIALISSLLIVRYVVRNPQRRHAYVRQSARMYTLSRFHLLPYTFLHLWRNKGYSLFFIFLLCFPLFVTAMYGTAAVNLVSNDNGLYGDAAYIVSRDDTAYGTAVTDQIAEDIRQLTGVESVQVVHKTNILYTFSDGDSSSQAQITELNAYTKDQFSRYVVAGSLENVLGNSQTIAVSDQQNRYSLGDTVTIRETDQTLTVAALLHNVPTGGRPLTYLADFRVMEDLQQADILPSEIHVFLEPSITSANDAAIKNTMPSLIYDPHASLTYQRDEIAVRNEDGGVTYRAAAAMNVQICIISVLSVFLFHIQKQTTRTREFDILCRLGYSHQKIRVLLFAESVLLLGIGFGMFAVLYGLYVNSIMQAIRESGAYQYSEFSYAWREMIVLTLGMCGVVSISNLLSYRPRKQNHGIERGEAYENTGPIRQ